MICFTFAESAPSAKTFCPNASKAAWTSGASSRRFCVVSRVVGGYIDSDIGSSCLALVDTNLTRLPTASGAIGRSLFGLHCCLVVAPAAPRTSSTENGGHSRRSRSPGPPASCYRAPPWRPRLELSFRSSRGWLCRKGGTEEAPKRGFREPFRKQSIQPHRTAHDGIWRG